MTQQRRTVKPFTGRHMAAILIAFFGVVIAVNVMMARYALSTFGGVVVENSYVASQHFNKWLNEARAEDALGWKATVARDGADGVLVALSDNAGKPIAGAKVAAIAEHPLGLRHDETLAFHETAPGRYAAPLQTGRWHLRVSVSAENHIWRTVGDVQ